MNNRYIIAVIVALVIIMIQLGSIDSKLNGIDLIRVNTGLTASRISDLGNR